MKYRIMSFLIAFSAVAVLQISGQEGTRGQRAPKMSGIGGVVAKPKPSMMDDTERLVLRGAAASSHRAATEAEKTGFADRVDGRTQPELLFRFELFDNLIKGLRADPVMRENAHKTFDARLRSFGYDPDRFWTTLESASRTYVARLDASKQKRGMSTFKTSAGKTLWVPISRDLCMDRDAALQSSRSGFGAAKFDDVLYAV
ncbi:MAG: hypothetical protein ACREO5_14140, partial [Candidatus Binatia bacterium]